MDALAEVGSGGPSNFSFGRHKHARTRLVTIRLVDERLAAEGRSPEHRDIVRLAAAADLKHAEVLTWPGGLRVVFSEDLFTPPPPPSGIAAAEAADERGATIARLQAKLQEPAPSPSPSP